MGTVRTTLLLRDTDRDNLNVVKELLDDVSDVEAIRRAIRITRQLLEWRRDGGDLVHQKGSVKERVVLV